ncbi:MAG: sigma-54 dependent transcriptional regulator [Thermoanaerobaculales bacterium]|nr:sigma-54 dependent transcriptional regulator [Thermoanaerobaculales bacterium]
MNQRTIVRSHGRVLLVDDDRSFLISLQVLLEDEGGYAVECAGSVDEALDVLDGGHAVHLVVTDLSMPGKDGIELLRAVKETRPELAVILMTAHGSVSTAVEAMRLGAFQYLTKPVDPDELLVQVERAFQVALVNTAYRSLKDRTGDPDSMDVLVGNGPGTADLRQTIAGLSKVDSTVLIRGETGTGKELVARLVHRHSHRGASPLIVVNCTAIPKDLLESELFGHEKGSFTGATALRRGRIEEAEGGTLLLDEIGDMPLELQPKLLRFLQERTYRRVGGCRDLKADIRVMAATHCDLEQRMADGRFRQDLFYRLNTIPVMVPPLRDHFEDLPELCDHLIAKISLRLRCKPRPVTSEALHALQSHPFPGNVRELENLLERALVLGAVAGNPDVITTHGLTLPPDTRTENTFETVPLEDGFAALHTIFAEAEAELIQRAFQRWPELANREIAERLGTNRRVLELRIKEHGLQKRT